MAERYDIFISYCRDNSEWVRNSLYEQLRQCRRSDGERPKIFLDTDGGVVHGVDWKWTLITAIDASTYVIPVFTPAYILSAPCRMELQVAYDSHLMSAAGKLKPILLDVAAKDDLPRHIQKISYVDVLNRDWFRNLCLGMGFKPGIAPPAQLKFFNQPANVPARVTLPPIQVEFQNRETGDLLSRNDQVTIRADRIGETSDGRAIVIQHDTENLQGTRSVNMVGGQVVFKDLSFIEPMGPLRLIASYEAEVVVSDLFHVVKVPPPPPSPTPPTVAEEGDVYFFASGKVFALMNQESVGIYTLQGSPLLPEGPVALPGRVRFVRSAGKLLTIADWLGNVHLFSDEGVHRSFSLGNGVPLVPGDLTFHNDELFVGLWCGIVFRISLESSQPKRIFDHPRGVQALAVIDDRCYVVDFQGVLSVYSLEKGKVNSHPLETAIWLLKAYPDRRLLAVGDSHLYQIRINPIQMLRDVSPIGLIAGVLPGLDFPILIDQQGMGASVDIELLTKSRFCTMVGARPVSADKQGRTCVFQNPDRTHSLLRDGRIVHTHSWGTLAVSPDGKRYAVGERGGVRILDATDFDKMIER